MAKETLVDDSNGVGIGFVWPPIGFCSRIRTCTIYLYPFLSDRLQQTDAVVDYFDGLANSWNRNYASSPHFKARLQVIQIMLRDARKGTALDLGCGSGYISLMLAGLGYDVFGVDVSSRMIDQARSIFEKRNQVGQFAVGDATNLKLASNFFDVVTCMSVLEWIEDIGKSIQEIARVMKPGGILIVSVPNKQSLPRKIEWALHKLKNKSRSLKKGYLLHQKHQFYPDEFDRLLSNHGLFREHGKYFVAPLGQFFPNNLLAKSKNWGMMYCGRYRKD